MKDVKQIVEYCQIQLEYYLKNFSDGTERLEEYSKKIDKRSLRYQEMFNYASLQCIQEFRRLIELIE